MAYEDYVAQVEAQKRRRELARMLSQGALANDRISAVGGVAVPYTWGEGLAKLGQAWIGRRAERKAEEEEKDLRRRRAEAVAAALSNYERSTPDDEVKSEILRRIESTPEGELMEPVMSRSDARRRLALELMPSDQAMELEMRREMYADRGPQGVQSTIIGEDGYYYTIDRLTGKPQNTGVKAAPNIKVLEQEGNVPVGVVTSRGPAGGLVPLGGAPGGPAVVRQPTAGERQREIESARADVELQTRPEIAKQTELARTEAERQASMPNQLADIQKMRRNIQGLLRAPGFDTIYGMSRRFSPSMLPGQKGADAQARLGQIDAQAFQTSIQSMRGLGALSNAEGLKVAAAFTRATDTNQSEESAREAWNEVLEMLDLAEERLRTGTTLRNRPTSAPTGELSDDDLLRMYGGS